MRHISHHHDTRYLMYAFIAEYHSRGAVRRDSSSDNSVFIVLIPIR